MRGIAVVVLSLAMACGAQASSIIVAGGAGTSASPSVIAFGSATPPRALPAELPATATPSVAALGEAVAAVGNDKVAAIPATTRHGPAHLPMVIRAGVVGGASAAPVASASAAAGNSTSAAVNASNGTLRDAMTQAGRAPAIAQ
jgi:hypothetical protein